MCDGALSPLNQKLRRAMTAKAVLSSTRSVSITGMSASARVAWTGERGRTDHTVPACFGGGEPHSKQIRQSLKEKIVVLAAADGYA